MSWIVEVELKDCVKKMEGVSKQGRLDFLKSVEQMICEVQVK